MEHIVTKNFGANSKVRSLAFLILFVSFLPLVSAGPSPVTFQFALPELQGTISLGVYDETGQLIRVLAKHAPTSSFRVGLNGLIGSWDGKANNGRLAPSGAYEIRGFVVGSLGVGNAKFHFNDWVEGINGPFPTKLLSLFSVPEGGFAVLWKTLDGEVQLAYYPDFKKPNWIRRIGSPIPPRSLYSISTDNLERSEYASMDDTFPNPPALPSNSGNMQLPASSTSQQIMDNSEDALTLSQGGIVHEWHEGSWHRVPLPLLAKKVARGYNNTIWLIADAPDTKEEFLGQFSIKGEFLRKVHLPPGESTSCLVASLDKDQVLMLRSKKDYSSRLVGYRFIKTADRKSTICKEFLNRRLIPCAQFGFAGSNLVPNHPVSSPLELSLLSDALNPRPGKVSLTALVEEDIAWLATEDGLPLFPVGRLQGLSRAVIAQNKQSVSLYCSNGSVVAEFPIRGIEKLQPIHTGWFEWK